MGDLRESGWGIGADLGELGLGDLALGTQVRASDGGTTHLTALNIMPDTEHHLVDLRTKWGTLSSVNFLGCISLSYRTERPIAYRTARWRGRMDPSEEGRMDTLEEYHLQRAIENSRQMENSRHDGENVPACTVMTLGGV